MSLEPPPPSLLLWPLTSYCWELTAAHQATRPAGLLAQCFTRGSRAAWETAKEEGWEGKGGVDDVGECGRI